MNSPLSVLRSPWVRLSVGLLILSALVYRFDLSSVLSTIKSADPVYLVYAVALYSVTFLILSFRWRMILLSMGCSLSMSEAYQAFAGGMIISDLTPGRVGELARPLLVRDRLDLSRGIASVAIDRYADIMTATLLGLLGLSLLSIKSSYLLLAASALLLLLIAPPLLWIYRRSAVLLLERLGLPRISSAASSLEASFDDVKGISSLLSRAVLLTAVSWVFQAMRIAVIARSVGFKPPIEMLVLLQPLASALSLVPVTISGLGLVEGGMTAILLGLGVHAAAGISIALIDRAITVAFHLAAGGRYASRML